MKRNTKVKGFTLIELIIVMAVFGLLLFGVMQLIDPVSKVMKQSAIQENNAASVNNMKEYLEKSLKYSEYIATFKGSPSKANPSDASKRLCITEEEAVKNFIEDYYTNRVNSNEEPLTGKVRVLKIDNKNGGRIYESVYDFKAKQTYPDATDPTKVNILNAVSINPVAGQVNVQSINPTYYQNYSYFIKLGYNESIPLQKSDLEKSPYKNNLASITDGSSYYARLSEVKNADGTDALYPFGPTMFSMSVMTYRNDSKGSNYMGNFDIEDDPNTAYNEAETVNVFKSPFYLSNSTMALPNIISTSVFSGYYGPVRDSSGNIKIDSTTNEKMYEPLTIAQAKVAVYEIPTDLDLSEKDNIYFIYTLPKEINRT